MASLGADIAAARDAGLGSPGTVSVSAAGGAAAATDLDVRGALHGLQWALCRRRAPAP